MKKLALLLLIFIPSLNFSQSTVKYKVVPPKNYSVDQTYPLFIALHGGYDNMNSLSKEWKTATLAEEFITVYMEASHQDRSPDRWGWRDVAAERKNVKRYYDEIVANYSVDTNQVYMGGFSLGAKMSVDAAMLNYVPVKGIVSVCHGGRFTDSVNQKNIDKALTRGVKFVVIYGQDDSKYKSQSTDLIKLIGSNNKSLTVYEMKGQGHELPNDFDDMMNEKWLPFLMN